MKQIWIVAKRELRSFFDSLMAYIMIVVFLAFSGFFTWLAKDSNVFIMGQASLRVFFSVAYWTLFFFIPALTMGLLAEENKTGTIELLLTRPVTDWHVVTGKFLAALVLIAITLAFTIPYYITVANLGKVDHSAIWCGWLGLLMMSAAYISIGVFASSVTNNQIVAFLIALLIGICFHFIFGILASSSTGLIGSIFNYLSLNTHYESVSRGVIDSKDVIYFLSIVFVGLLATEANLTKRA